MYVRVQVPKQVPILRVGRPPDPRPSYPTIPGSILVGTAAQNTPFGTSQFAFRTNPIQAKRASAHPASFARPGPAAAGLAGEGLGLQDATARLVNDRGGVLRGCS
jgi:hypothetical protein